MVISANAILASLAQAIMDGDEQRGRDLAQQALGAGLSPSNIFEECITPTLQQIGDKFKRLEIFLPEMMLSADVVKGITRVLEPVIFKEKGSVPSQGKVVIGTAQGDVHDIGKNMVATMLEVSGFKVYNLGVDVSTAAFLSKAREVRADIIAISSLLTTSTPFMKDVISFLEGARERNEYRVVVGGGPVTREWAQRIGADGYGKDAAEAVSVCRELVGSKKRG
ncbi:MAG: corrinoid protein [Chloroflexi bacterium]|nr:corrinoid protein [Chloroflexota bacterium]MCL5076127.1 corrinoid protein [Chloroflexota bacterium]